MVIFKGKPSPLLLHLLYLRGKHIGREVQLNPRGDFKLKIFAFHLYFPMTKHFTFARNKKSITRPLYSAGTHLPRGFFSLRLAFFYHYFEVTSPVAGNCKFHIQPHGAWFSKNRKMQKMRDHTAGNFQHYRLGIHEQNFFLTLFSSLCFQMARGYKALPSLPLRKLLILNYMLRESRLINAYCANASRGFRNQASVSPILKPSMPTTAQISPAETSLTFFSTSLTNTF